MFSALIKAFTGRAGFLPSLLALVLIALTAAAVLLNLPRIEQRLIESSQTVLQQNLGENDQLLSIQAEGRNLLIEGDFEDIAMLVAQLEQIDGVRGVRVIAAEGKLATEQSEVTEGSETAVADAIVADVNLVVAELDAKTESDIATSLESQDSSTSDESQAATVQDNVLEPLLESDAPQLDFATVESSEAETIEAIDQSSLVLRYDGTHLVLSGHLANEDMVESISREVSNAAPGDSKLEISIDSTGTPSSLNWMNDFLQAVAGLPDDAQGVIHGSDNKGVAIVPDSQQTLRAPADAASSENEAAPEGVSENEQQEMPEMPAPAVDAQVSSQQETQLQESLLITPESSTLDDTEQSAAGTNISQDAVQEEPVSTAEENLEMNVEFQVAESDRHVDTGPIPVPSAPEVAANRPSPMHPVQFIDGLNQRIAGQPVFEVGQYAISPEFAAELDALSRVMIQNPRLLLRVVGNLDFGVDPRNARFVGIDRAREIRDYITAHRVEPFRVFAAPLPRNYAFDKHIQIIFYITE
jgi:outer membrane protein OmpA-like peptidoglycan-associated protein